MRKPKAPIKPKIHKPEDLAQYVFEYFRELNPELDIPTLDVLQELFQCLFYASLHSEERQLIKVTITFFNPNMVEIETKNDSPDRWSHVPFERHIALDVGSLVKLSQAADPWSSSIAIHSDGNLKLWINGMIDQAIHLQSYMNLEADSKPDLPGLFQASIIGIGTLTVMTGFELIATLKQDNLITKYLNVFLSGPVSKIIGEISEKTDKEVVKFFEMEDVDHDFLDLYSTSSKLIYRKTLSRILNKIKNYNHGGALLISNDTSNLDIKYKLTYDRIRTTIIEYKINSINQAFETPENEDSEETVESKNLKLMKLQKELITKELKGAIRFVAAQSCVDGLILIDKSFIIRGFGIVIKDTDFPENIYISDTLIASERSLISRRAEHFGTRHRTMFAYCFNHPGSLGLVISQDGDIRAITRVKDKLVMWENIQIQKNLKNLKREVEKRPHKLIGSPKAR